jgi:uncharacterized protein (DUF1697 family)
VALVVLLRGVNVGGHRTIRPSILASHLQHLDVVNIGAAGTFVVRRPLSHARLRDELAGRLPFDTDVMICEGRDILGLMSRDFFAGHRSGRDVVRFVGVLARSPRAAPGTPIDIPSTGPWGVRILARERRFVVGLYRRQMRAIRCLGEIGRLFGAPVTTRNWNTVAAIARTLR